MGPYRFWFLSVLVFCGFHAQAADRHESSLGLLSTSGNTQVSSLALRHQSELRWDKDSLMAKGSFTRASNQNIETVSIWDIGFTYGRRVGPRYSLTLGEFIEGNRFQNLLQRYSTDLGLRYEVKKEGEWSASCSIGYRFARENYPYGFANYQFFRGMLDWKRTLLKGVEFSVLMEALPNFTEPDAWQANSEVALTTQLSSVFSMKNEFRWRYYHEPPVGVRYRGDTVLTTAIVARF